MQKSLGPFLVMMSLGLALNACTQKDKVSDSVKDDLAKPVATADWSGKMQELSGALNRLLPLVVSSQDFNNPTNAKAIADATDQLKKLSHQVRKLEKPSADPAYDSIAKMLDEDLARASTALRSGNRDYARLTIRDSIGYCIQCHTQTANGPSFPKLNLGFDPSEMTALGQGDYYAATRQFDAALAAYRTGVQDSAYARQDIFGWERAARSGLAIAVRLNENPKEARTIARAILKNKSAPDSLKKSAGAWNKQIERWMFEKKNRYNGENARLDRAETLIADADKRSQSEDGGQDITYLRASADLHQWLSQHPLKPGANETPRAKALFLAGRAAEESRELNFWTLHERYYELCIDTKPASDIAKMCFKKLNESVLMGYTGSSGLNLPPEESARLARLKEKSGG